MEAEEEDKGKGTVWISYSMTFAQWLDIHKGQRLGRLKELEGRYFACMMGTKVSAK